tara:strand:+ start:511 stop:816 length:306 start_codon:yes stop_codon:yes gene_type:complete
MHDIKSSGLAKTFLLCVLASSAIAFFITITYIAWISNDSPAIAQDTTIYEFFPMDTRMDASPRAYANLIGILHSPDTLDTWLLINPGNGENYWKQVPAPDN